MNINTSYVNKARYLFVTLIISLIVASQCLSQESEPKDSSSYEINEIVIVGTRAVERIIDIPYSVFRVDKKELAFGKKISAKDVLADVPGLFLQSQFGTHDLRISIRGFGTRSNSGVRGVRILQDGIPESEPDGETVLDAIDFTGLGGVEVVKGNLSSLYAKAPGGVINFLSDLYFPENYVTTLNQIGAYGYRQNGFRMGLKENNDRFLLSYNYRNFDGFRQHSANFQHLLNSVYEMHFGKLSSMTILGNYVNSFNLVPGSISIQEFNKDPFQANPFAISQDYKRATGKGRLALKIKSMLDEDGKNEFEVTGYGGIKELEKSDNDIYSFSTRYSLGALVHLSNRSEILGQKNILSVGMDYAFQSGPISEFDNLYGNKGISVKNEYVSSLNNIGFYFLDHFNLINEKLDVFFSGRFDKDVFHRDIFIPYGFRDTDRTFEKFTPKVGLNYKLLPYIALYSSYGLSYDFPALSEMANNKFTSNITYSLNPDLNPQTSKNFEIGIKGNTVDPDAEFMRKLFFEVTFFHYIINDEIVPFVINQQSYFRNAATTNRTGIEVGIKSEPIEETEVTLNYTYTNFTYESYIAEVFTPMGSSIENYSDNTVPSVPRHILNLIINHEFEISDHISGLFQFDCDFIDRMYVNDANTYSTADYFYANTMAGINFDLGRINAVSYISMNNIFDRRYVGFVNINEFFERFYDTGEPRSYSIGVNISFKP